MNPLRDVQLTVVSPFSRAAYSGMLPGTLAGLYEAPQMEIDLFRFTAGRGIRVIVAEVTGFEPEKRRVHFADRPPIRYDVAAIGIGSVPVAQNLWRDNPDVLSIKPMATFQSRFERRVNELAAAQDGDLQVAVVGAGAAGVEVSCCLESHFRKNGHQPKLSLIDGNNEILNGYGAKTIELARREFDRRGISIRNGDTVAGFENGNLIFDNGDRVKADLVVWATNADPPAVLDKFDLPKADDGFLAVRPTLQTTGDYRVFVVGDTATIVENPIRKAGVYAVREGPILWENIQRMLIDRPLVRYEPQKDFLSLLSTGDERAIVQYKGFSTHAGWAWKWKDHIDRKFMRMYQDYTPPSAEMMASNHADDTNGAPRMRCRGCGGKVGANVLSAALERLDIQPNAHSAQGLDQPDDAAILDPSAGPAEVISVDFFQSFFDDPYIVGRVAALNSLSDLWAMGSKPVGAMAMVTVPEGPPRQQTELLYQLLAGGVRELSAAGATLLGGHTTEGSDLTIGYTVIGSLEGRSPMTKANLKSGDKLILTKPLGTGVLLAGNEQCVCHAEWMDAALESMLTNNAVAAELAREFEVSALTDVTGFGLAGHLLEMLDASSIDSRISLSSLPLLDGFAELSNDGIRSSLDPANREAAARVNSDSQPVTESSSFDALFDPQTSGGLLIGIEPGRANELAGRLRGAGYHRAAVIGEVTNESKTPQITAGN